MIPIKGVLEIILVVLTVKLIVSRYKPPFQESIQALICIFVGTAIALVVDPSLSGFTTGIIGSGIAFYGKDLLGEFSNTKKEMDDFNKDNNI